MTAAKPTIGFEKITPEMAYELLANNTHNRNLRPGVVAAYARDMQEGRWNLTGEPITIAKGGQVLNGQHRLMAIVEADVTVELPVCRNMDVKAQGTADQGIKRTFGDVLMLEFGAKDPNVLAAAVRLVHEYRLFGTIGSGGTSRMFSVGELSDAFRREPNLVESVNPGRVLSRHVGIQASVAVACHYLFSEIDPVEVGPFYERAATGSDLGVGDPILALRRLFGRDKPHRAKMQSALLIKAFNFWREGREINHLVWRGGGSNPEPYPTIEPSQGEA